MAFGAPLAAVVPAAAPGGCPGARRGVRRRVSLDPRRTRRLDAPPSHGDRLWPRGGGSGARFPLRGHDRVWAGRQRAGAVLAVGAQVGRPRVPLGLDRPGHGLAGRRRPGHGPPNDPVLFSRPSRHPVLLCAVRKKRPQLPCDRRYRLPAAPGDSLSERRGASGQDPDPRPAGPSPHERPPAAEPEGRRSFVDLHAERSQGQAVAPARARGN